MAVTEAPAHGYGERIRLARLGVSKTRQQLADAVGVHYNSIARYERETAVPSDGTAIRIAKVTRTRVLWLLYGSEES